MKVIAIGSATKALFDTYKGNEISLITDIHETNLMSLLSQGTAAVDHMPFSSLFGAQKEGKQRFHNLSVYAEQAEYVMIDFLDEIFKGLYYKEECFTLTYDIQQAILEHNQEKPQWELHQNHFDEEWRKHCLHFIEVLQRHFSYDQIILHEVYLSEYVRLENGEMVQLENYEEAKLKNSMLKEMYSFFKQSYKGIGVIQVDEHYSEVNFAPTLKFNFPRGKYYEKLYIDLYNTFDNTLEYYKVPFTTYTYLLPHANIDFKLCAGGEAEIETYGGIEEKTIAFWTNFHDSVLKVDRTTVLPVLKKGAEYVVELDIEDSKDVDFTIVMNFFNDKGTVFYSQSCTSKQKIIATPKDFKFYRVYLKVKGTGKAHINYLKIRRNRKQGYVTAFDQIKHCPNSEDIKYLLKEHPSKYLVVVFHGFNPYVTKYEFLGVLKDVPVNKLYLLDDYGLNGRFYQDKNREDHLQMNIITLIEDIAQKCNVSKENIIMLGGSKGGGTALYYGLRMNAGHIVAGGPPIYWGIFNSSYYHQISLVKGVAGGLTQQDTEYMDSIVPFVLNQECQTKIEFLSITNDIYYEGYFEKFAKLLEQNGIAYHNELKEGKGHGDLPKYLGNWAKQTVLDIIQNG